MLWQPSVISILCYYAVTAVLLLISEFTGQSLITADISAVIFGPFRHLVNLPILPSHLTWQVLLSQIQLANTESLMHYYYCYYY